MALTLNFADAAERVKTSLDIVELIQRHVMLKKQGRNYVGLCPFHKDKNPSMTVHREKNLFKCFSCGVGGDALTFLMKLSNKNYPEVIRELADEQGIIIVDEGRSAEAIAEARDVRQKILNLNQRAGQWFQQALQSSTAVQEYLTRRGLSTDQIAHFQLGYAPEGWENLATHLKNTSEDVKQNTAILMNAGLVNEREQQPGHYYDRFRNRLIVPIHDEKGQIVAFGGRALPNLTGEDDKPKYLNSPETAVYHKSRVMYGLNFAKDTIRERKTAVIMEGYFDVISAHCHGITEAVGSCGTALTDQHLKLLTRFGAETLCLAFDADEAGQKAALSAITLIEPYLKAHPLDIKILVIPDGKDPDDFCKTHGGEAFRKLIDEALPYLAYKLKSALRGIDIKTPEGRVRAAHAVTPILADIAHPTQKSESIRNTAEQVGLSEEALRREVERYLQKISPNQAISDRSQRSFNRKSNPYTSNNTPILDNVLEIHQKLKPRSVAAERNLLQLLLLNTPCFQAIFPRTENITLSHPAYQTLLTGIRRVYHPEKSLEELLDNMLSTVNQLEQDNVLAIAETSLQGLVADFALSAEQFSKSFKLQETDVDTALKLADEALRVMDQSDRKVKINQWQQETRTLEDTSLIDTEAQAIGLQYQIKQEITAIRP